MALKGRISSVLEGASAMNSFAYLNWEPTMRADA